MRISPPQVWRAKQSLYKLAATKCNRCGNIDVYSSAFCSKCGSNEVSSINLSGNGTLIFSTKNFQQRAGYEKSMPQFVGLIKLDEGPEIVAPLTDVDEEPKEGSRVTAVLRKLTVDSSNGLIEYGLKFKVISDGP